MAVSALFVLASELTRKTGLRCAAVVGDGAYEFEINEEGRYQAALAELAASRSSGTVGVECMALLVPAPSNPHDPSSVLVQISGHDVGYLGRNLAPLVIRALANAGYSAAVAAAVIVRGSARANTGQFRVRLDAVYPFQFEEAGEEKPLAAGSRWPVAAAAIAAGTAALQSILPALQALSRVVLVSVENTSRWATNAYRRVRGSPMFRARLAWAAIFLAGMAAGSGLTSFWARPPRDQPVVAASPALAAPAPASAPPEPESAAEDSSGVLAPTADVPLPRPRPNPDAASAKAEAGATPQ